VFRSQNDAPALGRSDALIGAAEALARSQPHLDEDEGTAVGTDEVDFAAAAAIIAPEDGEAAALEEAGCEILGSRARAAAGRSGTMR